MSVPRAILLSMVILCGFAAGRILHEGVTLRQADEIGTPIPPDQDVPGKRLAIVAGLLGLAGLFLVAMHFKQWAQAASAGVAGAGAFVALIVGIGYLRAEREVNPAYLSAGVVGLILAAAGLGGLRLLPRAARSMPAAGVADSPGVATPRTGPPGL